MSSKKNVREAHAPAVLTAVFLAVSMVLPVHGQQPEIPPAGQPGAQQPRDLTSPLPVPTDDFRFRIPPVIERPLGVDEGARVFVHSFKLTGILQDPAAPDLESAAHRAVEQQFAIALETIERMRVERQRLTEIGPDGFTAAERQRVVEFMERAIRDMTPEERIMRYQQLVDELGLSRLEREQGMTIGQIVQIADAVTAIYRDRGFFLARAIIPAQDVANGVVNIHILEGRLGRARVEGNERYNTELLRRPFTKLEGQLITAERVESALFQLSDYPGLVAFGTFSPGADVGTADITVNVTTEKRFDFNLTVDNYGTGFTGERRVAAGLAVNNHFQVGDRMALTLMKTYKPEHTVLGQFDFETPIGGPHRKLRVNLARNTFDVIIRSGLFTQAFEGLSLNARVGLEQALIRGRNFNFYVQYDISRKRGETLQVGDTDPFAVDELAVHGLQVRFDKVDGTTNSLSSGFLRIDHGQDGIWGVPTVAEMQDPETARPSRANATPRFNKLTVGYSRLKLMTPNQTMLFRFNGQYTNDLLTPLEQYAVGGARQVRSSPPAIFLGDKGGFASLEWIIKAPFFADMTGPNGHRWGDVLSVSLFTDHTIAYINEPPRPQDRRFEVSGYGLGIHFQMPGAWAVSAEHARLRGGERGPNFIGDPGAITSPGQTWIEFRMGF